MSYRQSFRRVKSKKSNDGKHDDCEPFSAFLEWKEKPDNSIVLHILNKIYIAKCMTKYIANKERMYYTKRKKCEK